MFLTKFIIEICNGDRAAFDVFCDWFLCDAPSYHAEYQVYRKRVEKPELLSIKTILDIIAKFGDKQDRKIIGKYMVGLMKGIAVGEKKKHRSLLNFNLRKKRSFLWYFFPKPIPSWWSHRRITQEQLYRIKFCEIMGRGINTQNKPDA